MSLPYRVLAILFLGLGVLTGCSGTGVLNRMTPESGYERVSNLAYDPERNLRLDIYQPDNAQNAPVVVFFYGGRWSDGDKAQYKFVGQALASRGFVAVIPNYRLYPSVRFPAFVEDGARAVKWVRSKIGEHGGSPAKIFVMGHSAGAHIAAMLALDESHLKNVGLSRGVLRGMIGLAGPYDFMPITDPDLRDLFGPPESFEKSQPILYATGGNPPLLLMHGEDDEAVWVKNTRNLASAVAKAGGPVETVIYPKMSHSLIIGSLGPILRNNNDVLANIDLFVTKWSDPSFSRANRSPPPAIQTTPLELE